MDRRARRADANAYEEGLSPAARDFTALGYAPAHTEWIPVFAWLPDHAPGGPRRH